MCRLAAYLGPVLPLRRFLTEPDHSLVKQAWAPREMQGAVLNADGFGIGWYDESSKPQTYLNTLPIWADDNLKSLCASLQSRVWLGNVRSATPGQLTGLANTQPFIDGDDMYLHNGFLEDFNGGIRTRFHEHLRPDIQAGITGNTDSEYLYALLRQHLINEPDRGKALRYAINDIERLLDGKAALLNFILSDGNSLLALRHAINRQSPSLYYATGLADYSDAGMIASERLNDDPAWQAVPEHSLLKLEPDLTVSVEPL